MCDARRIPCTAHLELLDARELIAAGLHGIEHVTSFGVSLLPRMRGGGVSTGGAQEQRRAARRTLSSVCAAPTSTGRRHRRCTPCFANGSRFSMPRWRSSSAAPARHRPAGQRHAAGRRTQPMLVSGFAKMKQLTRRAAREGARVVDGRAHRGAVCRTRRSALAGTGAARREWVLAARGDHGGDQHGRGVSLSRQRARQPACRASTPTSSSCAANPTATCRPSGPSTA